MTDDILARLRDGKNWLNGGACCGDVDDAECCAAPACIFGEALKQFHEAADEIERLRGEVERLTLELAYMTVQRDQWVGACASYVSRAEAAERERDERNTRMWETAEELGGMEARAEAAEAKVAKLREALTPFAEAVDYYAIAASDEYPTDRGEFALGDLRRARTALQETEQ